MVESNGEDDNHRESSENVGGRRELKKGPWTAGEDGILIEYVKKHGEGNWNAVRKETGLARCGKSCRLRWANHLRPNLKKGSFSLDEERVVIELHAKLGNKWARMAAQLPGRTDNEIKNYWNTRMKRRQRAGLPLYPLEIHQQTTAFYPQQHPNHHSADADAAPTNFSADFITGNPNSVSIFHFSSTINITHNNFNDGSSFYGKPISQFNYFHEYNGGGGGFALPLSPVSTQLNYRCNSNSDFNSIEAQYYNLIPGLETGLPSILTSPPHSATPASSGNSCGDGNVAAHNSGLLDVVLTEAQARARNGRQWNEESSAAGELKRAVELNVAVGAGDNHSEEFSSSDSSSRKRARIEHLEMDSMEDDDLRSLLNNFQSEMSVLEWYPGNNDDNLGMNTHNGPSLFELRSNPKRDEQDQSDAASPSTVTSSVLEWTLALSCLNNMPNIC